MAYHLFYIKDIIHTNTEKDAKLFLSEMMINANADNTAIPMPLHIQPIKVFEVDVAEKLNIDEDIGQHIQW
jgi:hypothetical protein